MAFLPIDKKDEGCLNRVSENSGAISPLDGGKNVQGVRKIFEYGQEIRLYPSKVYLLILILLFFT
jgi:hypothetical protein